MKKILALDNITRYEQFLNEASKDFRTNIPINASTITSLLGYKDCFNKVVSIQYEGVGEMVDGASYQFMPTDIYLAMQNIMKKSLDESTVTTLPSSLITYESVFGSGTAPFYYLPSATVTEKGKSTVTYGVDTQGNLVSLNSKNSGNYVSTSGGSVQSDSSSGSSSSSSDSTATSSSDSTYQQDNTYNDGYNNSNDSTTSSYGTDDTNTGNYGYGTSQ
jgi:polyisoprenyl-teichoic acid--peptidoglycan teichoic acid transferase